MPSHSWNKELELEKYTENTQLFGVGVAREISRANGRSWRNGLKDWTLRVDREHNDVKTGKENVSLREMVRNPVYSKHAYLVDDSIKEMMPIQTATIDQAVDLANEGQPVIFVPEQHLRKDGEKVVRYYDVWTQDQNNPDLYHGSSIDLGKDFAMEEAREKVIQTMKNSSEVRLHQDKIHKDAFVLSSELPRAREYIQNLIIKAVHETSRITQHISAELKTGVRSVESKLLPYIHKKLQDMKFIGLYLHTKARALMEKTRRRVDQLIQKIQERLFKPAISLLQSKNDTENYVHKSSSRQRIITVLFIGEKRIAKPTALAAYNVIEKFVVRNERKAQKMEAREERRREVFQYKDVKVQRRTESKIKRKTEVKRIIRRNREEPVIFAEKKKLKRQKIVVREQLVFSQRKMKKEAVRHARKEKVIQLITLVRKLVRRKERIIVARIKKPETTRVKRAEKKQKAKEQVLNFSIAFIFWILMSERYHVPLHDNKKEAAKMSERLQQKKSTQWILLAIIWHLAMIREQGYVQRQSLKRKKVKKITFYPQLALRGVIFAYAT